MSDHLSQHDVSRITGLGTRRLRRYDAELGVRTWAGRPCWPADRVAAFVDQLAKERALIAATLSSSEVAERAGCSRDHVIKNYPPIAVVAVSRQFRYEPEIVAEVIEGLTRSRERKAERLRALATTRTQVVPSSAGLAPTAILPTAGKAPKKVVRARNGKAARVAAEVERVRTEAVEAVDRKSRKRGAR